MTMQPEWPFSHVKPAREVQMEALRKGYGKPGFAYFLRQRLGKTLLAYAEFTLLREEGKVDWLVIICPNSLKTQWMEAIEEVDPYTPICIYSSQTRAAVEKWFNKNKKGGVLIINYESMNAFMSGEFWNKFDTIRTYLIADESTKIKEPSKKMSKAALEFSTICMYKRVLTGKPQANSHADLWSQLKFVNATQRNFHQHKFYFCIIGGFQGRQTMKNINTQQLQAEMDPYCYIAPDKYINQFEKIYEPMREVKLQTDQKRMYEEMQNDLLIQLSEDVKISAPIVLVQYLRLQQISSGIAGDIDGVQHNIVPPEDNPRIKIVKEILENEVENKCIIVCRFKLSIENLYNELTKAGYKCTTMTGGMEGQLDINKKHFIDPDGAQILIAQTQVLSYGHTLCGEDRNPCTDVIFYENDFSLLNRSQCESRPEKMERQMPISYYDMYASKMDKYILKSLIRKEEGSMALMNYSRQYGILPQPDAA